MRSEGVMRTVQIGTGLEMSRKALELARDWGRDTWCAAGLHPSDCQDMSADSAHALMTQLENFIRENRDKMVAVGEAGLDYYHLTRGREDKQRETQQAFFTLQAQLALRLDLPLVIHTRNAAADTIALIKEHGIKRAVIHCFSENTAFARELLKWSDGIYFSFSGILTYKKAPAVQETAQALPLNRILVETDAPFLVPQILRETYSVNEPAFTRHVLDFLKTLRSEPGEEIEKTVWKNSNTFFRV
jgi:TatD DNase family protein